MTNNNNSCSVVWCSSCSVLAISQERISVLKFSHWPSSFTKVHEHLSISRRIEKKKEGGCNEKGKISTELGLII